MGTGTRRRAREAALKILFQMDLAGTPAEEAIAAYWDCFDLEAEGDEYAGVLVRGVAERLADVDEAIRNASTRWRIDRMALVDRNVLRIGAYELLYFGDIPTRVVLDEAIELGKRFGSEESGAFVNGVLDRLAHLARGEPGADEGEG
jgi:transcription antitermination protein NusB